MTVLLGKLNATEIRSGTLAEVLEPIRVLIRLLRGSEMPWIGDEIEEAIAIGKVQLFDKDEDEVDRQKRQASLIGDEFTSDPQERSTYIDMEAADNLSLNEQADLASKILEAQIILRLQLIDAALTSSSLKADVAIRVCSADGSSAEFFTNASRSAAKELEDALPQIRQWLLEGAR